MGVDEDLDEETEEPATNHDDTDVITADSSHLYAIDGRQRSETIELQGTIGACPVAILVDTGSTHDFLHPRIAAKLALPLRPVRPFRVYVGNGASFICSHASISTRLVSQSQVFIVDLHILPVHGPDLILGMAWLKSLRRVTSDYEKWTLEFVKDGKPVCLNIAPQLPKQVSVKSFASILSLQGEAQVFEIVSMPSPLAENTDAGTLSFPADIPDQIRGVLEQHVLVFGLPSGMPPARFCDHRIHLLPQTKPVNVRPYRYPYFQKTEIEKQVWEMLEAGVIRPSQSTFSSPVLLIRKKVGTFRFCIDYRAR